ncbi:MAG: hypothetical protein IPI07_05315 [Flavobacteriales bacterium]|nr:hypothetical protein [Flavobacteriales bacterium]
MAKDPFLDPANPPDDKALGARIGEAFTVVKAAVEACDTGKARITFAWKFSKTSGWYVTCDRGSKRLFYLFLPGDFLLRMVFSVKGGRPGRSGWNSAYRERTTGRSEKIPGGHVGGSYKSRGEHCGAHHLVDDQVDRLAAR